LFNSAAAGADVQLADPNTGNAAQMAAAVGHIEVVEKLVEAGCAWPHGKKANSGLGAPVDVVQLLSQKSGIPVSCLMDICCVVLVKCVFCNPSH
jgi:proteasome assembly chaperone (PAC2) family protein